MPYVRKHGHQVALVHGERDATGQVQQRVLFSLYSKPEAEAAIGLRKTDPPLSFHGLVESRHEGIRFDWPKLDAAISALKDELPDRYDYPSSGVAPVLREGVVALTRGLLAANPQSVFSAGQALRDQREALLFVRELIDVRLRLVDKLAEHAFNRDNEFGWLARVAGKGVPPEAEEWLGGFQERREFDRAEALAAVLVEAWPEYADGYNVLGLCALERGEWDRALEWFARTMEVGRKLFPKRIAKSRWWSDHDTRPYMRGMRNTALTLLWAGSSGDVLGWCDRLEQECFDEITANVYRASALLNLGRWQAARHAAARNLDLWPSEDFVAAFAAFELGEREDALARWLHAAVVMPRAARLLTGGGTRGAPKGREEVQDHNAGVELQRAISAHLERAPARRFFAAITSAPEVVALIEERAAAVQAWHENRGPDRAAYDRMMEMATAAWARRQAAGLRHLAGARVPASRARAQLFDIEVSLAGVSPPVWRRFWLRAQGTTFADLHRTLQDVCGWTDSHLYRFEEEGPGGRVGLAQCPIEMDEEVDASPAADEVTLASWVGDHTPRACRYIYDFGDHWVHDVVVRGLVETNEPSYRKLIAGERAFPPEDCGGLSGFEEVVEFRKTGVNPDPAVDLGRWLGGWQPTIDLAALRDRFDNARKPRTRG